MTLSSNRDPALAFWWSMIFGVPPESETRIIGTVLEERTDAQTEITCFQPCIQVGGGAADDGRGECQRAVTGAAGSAQGSVLLASALSCGRSRGSPRQRAAA